jgi:hypothetical protein
MEKVRLKMAVPRSRPFQLFDGMILITAVAAWMASMRHWWHEVWEFHRVFQGPPPWQIFVGPVHNGLWTMLWVLSAAYLVMRLIRPRPPWSDLIRQPGVLFFELMIAFILIVLCQFVPTETMETWGLTVLGLALALLWIAVSRYWRSGAERGWIEAFGRAVAVGWIMIITANNPVIFLAFWLSH